MPACWSRSARPPASPASRSASADRGLADRWRSRRTARPSTPPPPPRPPRSAPPPTSPAASINGGYFAIDPDGKTAYAVGPVGAATGLVRATVTPVNLATNTPGKPFRLCSNPHTIAFTPDGKTAYVTCPGPSRHGHRLTRPPTRPAGRSPSEPCPCHRHHPGREDRLCPGADTVTPISTATNTPGKPIRLGSTPDAIAITPDGKTAYVGATGTVIPISTATNTPGTPIRIGAGIPAEDIAFTPDGKTAYVANEGPTGRVVPISTATGTPGKPILIGVGAIIAITPDGKTVYAAAHNKVVPISTVTNTPGKPIRLPDGLPTWIVATP